MSYSLETIWYTLPPYIHQVNVKKQKTKQKNKKLFHTSSIKCFLVTCSLAIAKDSLCT